MAIVKTSYNLKKADINQFVSDLNLPMKGIVKFWSMLGLKLDQFAQLTLRLSGARAGHNRWPSHSLLSLHPSWKAVKSSFPEYAGYHYNPDKWNRRRGTDNSKTRRYSNNSQILKASGGFAKSFTIQEITPDHLIYGTRHTKDMPARDIMTGHGKERPVLFITDSDRQEIYNLFRNYVYKEYFE